MANIQPYLDNIMRATYGEEVRGSIHDAIDAINKYGENITATAKTLPPSSQATVTVTSSETGTKLDFGIPQGEKGRDGLGTIAGVTLNSTPLEPNEAGVIAINCIKTISAWKAVDEHESWLEIAKLAPAAVVGLSSCATTFLVCGGDNYGENYRELYVVNFGTRWVFYMSATQISTYSHISAVEFGYWKDEDEYYHIGAKRPPYSSYMQFYQLLEVPETDLIEVFDIPKHYAQPPIGWTPVKTDRAYSENNKEELAFKSDVVAAQLALASLYESRSTPIASADMPMSSPSIEDELSVLDQNMIKVYADLCLNPYSGKSVSDVPENLRVYVSTVVEKTLAERKETEERYKAEMERHETDNRKEE